MKIYIVILEDRHIDVLVYPFRDKEAAIAKARELAEEKAARYSFAIEEEQIPEMLYYAEFSGIGGNVHVVEAELDETRVKEEFLRDCPTCQETGRGLR